MPAMHQDKNASGSLCSKLHWFMSASTPFPVPKQDTAASCQVSQYGFLSLIQIPASRSVYEQVPPDTEQPFTSLNFKIYKPSRWDSGRLNSSSLPSLKQQ